jgi:hypothetical protein
VDASHLHCVTHQRYLRLDLVLKVAVIISTGTGFSKRLTGFKVPDITTSLVYGI